MDSEERSFRILATATPLTHAFHLSASQHVPPAPDSKSKGAFLPSTGPVGIGFFRLPREIRNAIYKRVLLIAHPLFLFQDPGFRVEAFAPDRPLRWLALLHTNRQIHSEATEVIYGVNVFSLADSTSQQVGLLQSFLDTIGSVNAGFLSHLCINFPVAESIEVQPENFQLRNDTLQSFKLLQEKTIRLTTLELFMHGHNSRGLFESDTSPIKRVLSQVDVQLKAIPSLLKIVVRTFGETPTSSVIESMQELGWVILRSHGRQRQ